MFSVEKSHSVLDPHYGISNRDSQMCRVTRCLLLSESG